MQDFKLNEQERDLVAAAEPMLHEFAEGLDPKQLDIWYLECAELLCDLAHSYWSRCEAAGEPPLMESWLDEATITLMTKRYLREQLDEAFDLFHGGVL